MFTVVPVCRPNPCQNGGTCSRQRRRSKFTCACPDQFKGTLCEIGMGLYHHFSRISEPHRRPLESFICWGLGRTGFKSRFPSTAIASAFQPKGIGCVLLRVKDAINRDICRQVKYIRASLVLNAAQCTSSCLSKIKEFGCQPPPPGDSVFLSWVEGGTFSSHLLSGTCGEISG